MNESEQGSLTSPTEPWCITCGYDLRSLPTEQSCPECGTPIELSLRGHSLAAADPIWLGSLVRGQSLLLIAGRIGLGGILIAITIPIITVASLMKGAWFSDRVFWFSITSLGGIMMVGSIVGAVGGFLITYRDPRESLRERSFSSRRIARIGIFATIALPVLGLALDLIPLPGGLLLPIVVTIILLIGASLTLATVAMLKWLAALAQRIPDPKLARQTTALGRFFYWALPGTISLGLYYSLATPVVAGMSTGIIVKSLLFAVPGCAMMALSLALLIGFVRLLTVFSDYRRAFRVCLNKAIADRGSKECLPSAD